MSEFTVLHFGIVSTDPAARPDVAGHAEPTDPRAFILPTFLDDAHAVVDGSWAHWGQDPDPSHDLTLHVVVTLPPTYDADGAPLPVRDETIAMVADDLRERMGHWSRLLDYCIESEPEWSEGQVLHVLPASDVTRTWTRPVPEFACADCGTTTARTYSVTTLDYDDPIGTRTEVCLPRRMCGAKKGPLESINAELAAAREAAFTTVHESIVADLATDAEAAEFRMLTPEEVRAGMFPNLPTDEEIRETAEYDHAMDDALPADLLEHGIEDEDDARLIRKYDGE